MVTKTHNEGTLLLPKDANEDQDMAEGNDVAATLEAADSSFDDLETAQETDFSEVDAELAVDPETDDAYAALDASAEAGAPVDEALIIDAPAAPKQSGSTRTDRGQKAAGTEGPRILNQHPLRARRRPGPPGSDAKPRPDQDLEDALRVLELIERGVLPSEGPPALPVKVDASGKPLRRLTADDEKALAERIQTWGDVDARNALVLANLGLVHLVANQMRRNGVRYEDLVQEGTLGLLRATETFEPHRNVRFSTYCVYWIRAKIQRFLQRLDRDDTPAIAGAEMETLAGGRRRRPRARSLSIDTPMDEDDDRSVGDVLKDDSEDPEDATLRFERGRAVTDVLEGIVEEIGDPRLRTIIEKRLLAEEPETLATLGDRLNLSREGARLLENKVLKLARQRLHEFRDHAGQ